MQCGRWGPCQEALGPIIRRTFHKIRGRVLSELHCQTETVACPWKSSHYSSHLTKQHTSCSWEPWLFAPWQCTPPNHFPKHALLTRRGRPCEKPHKDNILWDLRQISFQGGGAVEIPSEGGESRFLQEFFLIDSSCICQIGDNRNLLDGKLPNISFHNFKTLGACQWLDDEIINYFVNKWCSRSSTTLGLSTFFACKFLFQDDDNSCVHARHGILTGEDEYSALRWCRRAEVSCSHFTHSMTVLLPFTRGVWGLIRQVGTRYLYRSMKIIRTGIPPTLISNRNVSTFMIAGRKLVWSTNKNLFYNGKIQGWCL